MDKRIGWKKPNSQYLWDVRINTHLFQGSLIFEKLRKVSRALFSWILNNLMGCVEELLESQIIIKNCKKCGISAL